MAGELLSFGIQKVWDLLSNEYEQFQGFEDQVVELKSDLNLLRSFLKDAISKKYASAMVKKCIEDVKEIILDAEDILETFLLKDRFEKKTGIKKSIEKLACNVSDRRGIGIDIIKICKRISKVIRDMQNFGVQQMIIDGDRFSHPLQERQREMRQTFPWDNESDFVGLETNITELVGYLLEEDNIQVVSITGMGGLGKTTLARHVFNHEMVREKFDRLAWVCVSQDFKRKDVWQMILRDLRPKEEEKRILQMTEPTLQRELFQTLEASKTLIVLDDIWTKEAWNLIKHVFPAVKGCRVLLTSRNDSVVKHGNKPFFNFKLECLTAEESWSLFQRIAFPQNNSFGKPIYDCTIGRKSVPKRDLRLFCDENKFVAK